jgi:serine/threonine-protein kinase RsbT
VSKSERDRFGRLISDGPISSVPALERHSSGRVRAGARASRPSIEYASDVDRILAILEEQVSAMNARVLLEKALQERNLTLDNCTVDNLRSIGGPLRRGIELFVRPDKRKGVFDAISALLGPECMEPAACVVTIKIEPDITVARNEARRICEDMGVKSFPMHKVMTIVSELARNIVSYTKGGSLEISPVHSPLKSIRIRSSDQGPGIPHLNVVLNGSYQSKTGLGKGIIGTKRLADAFDITTGPSGTVVVAEVRL